MRVFVIVVVAALSLAVAGAGMYAFSHQKPKTESINQRLGKIIDLVNKQNSGWKAGLNSKFEEADLEHIKSLLGAKKGGVKLAKKFANHKYKAPIAFDSRTQWPQCTSISQIRDQSTCGSCWAFGAAEAMSDRICIASKGQKKVNVSPADLMECCSSCGFGCNGGYPSSAWHYWKQTGLVSGGLYGDNATCSPYPFAPCAHHVDSTKYPKCGPSRPTPSCTKTCNSASGLDWNTNKTYGKSAYSIPGATAMAQEISKFGPIEVSFDVYEDFLAYKSGVYRHVSGNFLGGHAVRILGYGTEAGNDYWLVANSWNESWGDNGYFKILRGSDECGIEGNAVAGEPQL